MPRQRLTDRLVTNRKPPATGTLEIWDDLVRGFGIRIGYGGKKTYFTMFRINGKQVRRTIGAYPVMSLAEARAKAREILSDAVIGIDAREREREERIEG
ncbi:MAG: Arm DNA-binding domain-containing protein, partial [Proteobacteria bacterium]|nr:Arm DNA-binding domain-containing protein [Pseudomonadota bacterium]